MKQKFEYLMRPWLGAPPRDGRRRSIPELRERAKTLFANAVEAIGGSQRLEQRKRFTRKERREILGWLTPVEKLTCAMLLVKAVTRLLMTPEGRRLMKETPKQALWKELQPEPPKPAATRSTRIPHPGWHTIWRPPSPPPPPPPPKPAMPARTPFRVLRITDPQPARSAPLPSCRPAIIDLFAEPLPAPKPPSRKPSSCGNDAPADRPCRIARRIAALSRALENPEPIVRRLARFIAGLPHGLLQPSTADRAAARGLWRHGQPEFVDTCFHARRAITALYRLEPG